MPVIRYRSVADMPSALIGDDDMTPAEGLRLACELSQTAQRLAGTRNTPNGVRRHPALTGTGPGQHASSPRTDS